MRFSMLYSGEQILSFKSCRVFYTGDSLRYDLRANIQLIKFHILSVYATASKFVSIKRRKKIKASMSL